MPLAAGDRLGPYEILAPLGAGGMGEVYRGRDTRLGRTVAIKVSVAQFSQRFEREARAAGALNHPHICTLYDVGPNYLVMELLEGKTLSERMGGQPVKMDEMLELAIQIADGLNAAHQKGIIHRDIKPSNIFVTTRGDAKIMDFGLAKLASEPVGSGAGVATQAATVTLASELITDPGTAMGTIAYMSPEQARGEDLDGRTDLFSFGVVLYEMATGSRPFHGTTMALVFYAILHDAPVPPLQLRPDMPPALEHLIRKLLEKDRDLRYQTASDLRSDLKRLKRDSDSGRSAVFSAPVLSARLPTRRGVLAAGAFATLVAGFGAYKWLAPAPVPFQHVEMIRLTNTGNIRAAVISPDGRYVLHVTSEAGKRSIWMRQIATGSYLTIMPPSDALFGALSFSRDGNFLYYLVIDRVYNTLYEMPALGGAPRKLIADVDSAASPSLDGKRLAFLRRNTKAGEVAIVTANSDGSGEQKISARIHHGSYDSAPAWSPDGKVIACAIREADSAGYHAGVIVVPATGGHEKLVAPPRWFVVTAVAWLSSGRGLVVAAKDDSRSRIQLWYLSYPGGTVRQITNDLSYYGYVGSPQPALRSDLSLTADSTVMAIVQSGHTSNLWTADTAQPENARKVTTSLTRDDGSRGLAWTPDGKLVYAAPTDGYSAIWIANSDGSSPRRLTMDAHNNVSPEVTPDGKYVVFVSDRNGIYNIWRVDIDGGGLKQLTNGHNDEMPYCSPDGKWVVYNNYADKFTLQKVSIDGDSHAVITRENENGSFPVYSPDGKYLAFNYRSEGPDAKDVVVVRSLIDSTNKTLDIPSYFFRWTPDGGALAYIRNHGGVSNIWTQPLSGGPPKQLTNFSFDQIFCFNWSPDGKQLAVARGTTTSDVVLIRDLK